MKDRPFPQNPDEMQEYTLIHWNKEGKVEVTHFSANVSGAYEYVEQEKAKYPDAIVFVVIGNLTTREEVEGACKATKEMIENDREGYGDFHDNLFQRN